MRFSVVSLALFVAVAVVEPTSASMSGFEPSSSIDPAIKHLSLRGDRNTLTRKQNKKPYDPRRRCGQAVLSKGTIEYLQPPMEGNGRYECKKLKENHGGPWGEFEIFINNEYCSTCAFWKYVYEIVLLPPLSFLLRLYIDIACTYHLQFRGIKCAGESQFVLEATGDIKKEKDSATETVYVMWARIGARANKLD